jgi:hypothetical protein
MGGICIGEKEIHLQFGLTRSRNFLVKLQYWQYIAINFYLLHTQEHCHLLIGRKKVPTNKQYILPEVSRTVSYHMTDFAHYSKKNHAINNPRRWAI